MENKHTDLTDIILLGMAAVLCGAKKRKSFQIFVRSKIDWLELNREFPSEIATRQSISHIIPI